LMISATCETYTLCLFAFSKRNSYLSFFSD